MREELPQGWADTTLGELCSQPQYGWTTRSAQKGLIKYVRTTDISDGGIEWATVPFCEIAPEDVKKYAITPNDILVSRAGSVGVSIRVLTVPCDAVFASYLIRFKPVSGVLPEYVSLFLKSGEYWKSISEFASGIAVPNVNASKLSSLELPLAPYNEQRRIVERLEKLLATVDQCKERMAKIPVLLKRFRQSVLAAACSGRLTADWRETHRAEREDSGNGDDLPFGWRSVAVGDVIDDLRYGTSTKCSPQPSGTAVLRIPNIGSGIIDHSELKYARLPEAERKKLALAPGDVLMIRSNGSVSLVGKTAVVGVQEKGFAYAGYLIRLRVKSDAILPLYLHFSFASSDMRQQIEIPARSTSGVNNINSEEVRQLNLLLPPVEEQREIVQHAAKLLALADRIEERYQGAKKQVDSLTQSILAKAFRGKLVPTEAELAAREGRSYESAEQLLQRIQASGRQTHTEKKMNSRQTMEKSKS